MSLFKKNYDFKLADVEAGHFHVTFKGIPAVKCPFDYLLYQMLLWKVKPNHFIIDRKWCDFFGPNVTFNVNGYLKRIA